jgi:hypothetical protein
MPALAPFTPGGTVSLSCTVASASVALNLPASQQLTITNLGPDIAYVAMGGSTVVATTSGFPVLPGTQITVTIAQTWTFLAAICPTSTGTLLLTSGDGVVSGVSASAATLSSPGVDSVFISGGSVGLLGGTASIGYLGGFLYNNISTDATTQVKSGAGVLHSVSVNTAGTVASSVSVYDSTSTTTPVIGIFNALATDFYILDAAFATGLRVVTTGTVAPNVTITYR